MAITTTGIVRTYLPSTQRACPHVVVTITYTWQKLERLKIFGSWMLGNPHVQISQRGAEYDNSPRLYQYRFNKTEDCGMGQNRLAKSRYDMSLSYKNAFTLLHAAKAFVVVEILKIVRKLQKTLMNSWSCTRLLAVRTGITQITVVRRRQEWMELKSLSPEARMKLVGQLKLTGKSKPTRRVWIPKPGRDEKRPLGIPTMYDTEPIGSEPSAKAMARERRPCKE